MVGAGADGARPRGDRCLRRPRPPRRGADFVLESIGLHLRLQEICDGIPLDRE
jgi:hypothetical protein